MVVAVAAALAGLAMHIRVAQSMVTPQLQSRESTYSYNVSSCPGYTLSNVAETNTGLTGDLGLAGPACNAYGNDHANLTLKVTYDSNARLHVNIVDADNSQFTIPNSLISLPGDPKDSFTKSADLVFNYEASPFAFWITRRAEPDAEPLFDTRISSLPPTPIPATDPSQNRTALDGFPLVFEDQYLQLTSSLPYNANIYGLGEAVASSGFRRDVGANGGPGTIQTSWARDIADPIDGNLYGTHPVYVEHRFNETTGIAQSHGVYLHNIAGSDILLLTPPNTNKSLIQYRLLGGVLDLYFLSGPDPKTVIEQYSDLIGTPTWQPAWGFGFHLCRWGYTGVEDTRAQVQAMKAANIPLETMWNDIDLYQAYRDFTTDPNGYNTSSIKAFTEELAANNQHYIPIVDAAIGVLTNSSDVYDTYTRGTELDTFIKNPDGSQYVGQVWPGYTVFPDWFAENTQKWWTEALRNWSTVAGVKFSGIWLDMNEPSSFCVGSCGSQADLTNTTPPFILPGQPGNLVTQYPEGYNANVSGPSGNMTVNGVSTYGAGGNPATSKLSKRGNGASSQTGVDLNAPPYAINNGAGALAGSTVATNATHANGAVELDVHNVFGMMEEIATNNALREILPGKRPFIIGRSTHAGAGKYTGHWLGDNFSTWQYLYLQIQGILQFQLFQIPMVGADTCGFVGNTDEELCNRWMSLSAFVPFYRNHNIKGAISQEPYRWDSVANATRSAINVRYSLLPYWYTLFADASRKGTPAVRALWYEFPTEQELYGVDRQWLVGGDILVTPVLTPNVTSVDGIFPGRGNTTWRDWYTHETVDAVSGGNTTLDAPLSFINVHVRDGAAILTHTTPGYTIAETRQSDYGLLVSLKADGSASGTGYMDDGESLPPTPSRDVTFTVAKNTLKIESSGSYPVTNKLAALTVLVNGDAAKTAITKVTVNGAPAADFKWDSTKGELTVTNLTVDLNTPSTISWSS